MPRSAAAEVADYHTRAKSGLKTEFQALARAAFAEFSACLLFVFFGAGSVSAAVQAVSPAGYVVVEPSNYALSFGFLITILAFAIGDCSGAHINPAVTFSLAVTQNIEPRKAAAYMVAQFTGAFAGGGLLRLALGATAYKSGIGLSVDAGGGLIFEFMGTLLLIFVVFNVAVWSGGAAATDLGGSVISSIAPLPIGLAVMVAHLALGPFTGCGINPARVLGAVVWEDGFFEGAAGQSFWIYFGASRPLDPRACWSLRALRLAPTCLLLFQRSADIDTRLRSGTLPRVPCRAALLLCHGRHPQPGQRRRSLDAAL